MAQKCIECWCIFFVILVDTILGNVFVIKVFAKLNNQLHYRFIFSANDILVIVIII